MTSRQEFPVGLGGGPLVELADGRFLLVGRGRATVMGPASGLRPEIVAVTRAGDLYASDAISPGEIVTVFGFRMGLEEGRTFELTDGRIPTTLAGTRVLMNGVAAPLLYVQANQINAIAPFALADSEFVDIQVVTAEAEGPVLRQRRVDASPSLFRRQDDEVAALNQDGSVNSRENPAAPGSIVALFGTGAGAFSPALRDGSIPADATSRIAGEVSASFSGFPSLPAEIVYAGVAPGLPAGVFQINVRVPERVNNYPLRVAVKIAGWGDTALLWVHR